MHPSSVPAALLAGVFLSLELQSAELPSSPVVSLAVSNAQVRLDWTPYPATAAYHVERARTPVEVFEAAVAGEQGAFSWSGPRDSGGGFFRVTAEPMSDDALLVANVLNRLAYGPSPDELNRLLSSQSPLGGGQAYIQEQLAPEGIPDSFDTEPIGSGWTYVTATGTATGGRFYIYLNGAGALYVDDVKVVHGTVPEVGANLLVNGDFEAPLAPKWLMNTAYNGSAVSTDVAHSGASSLLLTGTAAGSQSSSVYQDFSGWKAGELYTLSFWYLPTNVTGLRVTARLTGSSAVADQSVVPVMTPIASAYQQLAGATATVATLRAWYVMRAVAAPRQLHEILTQFLDNHFVTEHSKSYDFFNRYYTDGTQLDRLATDLEFREITRWRQLLLNPQCTFLDLLKASAESPAQILYLDTVDSRGDGSYIANENYSRELMELYTMGVDNGYDQADITTMSRAWTGWSVRIVDPVDVGNPFALQTTNRLNTTLTNTASLNAISNLVGVWTYAFRPTRHNAKAKVIFPSKTVPARFGAPWAGRAYQLSIPARSGNDGIQDGYDILNHLAALPFTEEFISVKLCRLFVHDGFVHGQYDYTDPDLTDEARLVHDCMLAWENGNPKGQIRDVLRVIFASDLFRRHGGSMQKVKTPLEFCVSAIRALRGSLGNGRYSASTDGGSIVGRDRGAGTAPMTRMGMMRLFNRVEPDGYPEAAPGWISAGTLAERAHFIQSYLMPSTDAQKADGITGGNKNVCDPVALLKARIPATQWSDPGAVADYFLGILFPAEGRGNLADHRALCIRFLDLSDDGKTASPFRLLGVDTSAYDLRVRALLSVLMMSPRFQEQ